MDRGNEEGKIILRRALWRNWFNIFTCYPKLSYVARHRARYSERFKLRFVKSLVRKILRTSNIKVVAHGTENIPSKDGCFICCNHQQKFDPLAIWNTFPKSVRVIVEEEVTDRPFIYEICELTRSCKINRNSNRDAYNAFKHITSDLVNGANYLIFPEGEYNSDVKHLLPFKNGCFKAPLGAKVPIIPAAIIDSNKVLLGHFFQSYKIHVYYLEPINPEDYEGMKTCEISSMVQSRIQAVVDEYQK